MNVTVEQRQAIERILSDYSLPVDFKWWLNDNELFLRLDEKTVIAVHSSGMITKHISQ